MFTKHPKVLVGIAVVSFLISLANPMLFILPLVIVTYLFRENVARIFSSRSLAFSYIFLGTVIGLFVELFAILDNIKKPEMERVLMSPNPLTDLFFGIFYYSLVVFVWYVLLKKYAFSKKEVFFLTGITLGLFTEQMGAIFFGMFASVAGVFVAMFVIIVYGIFPTLAYMLTENRFDTSRQPVGVRAYFFAVALLFLQWAFFGLIVLPLLKVIV